ncbi:hypothetical protein EDD76_10499 [Kineothrix alysoides]|uniref:Glycosyl transferase n=1 Tax=Kineothrix alysoides TaxID=1469948 RepID=A0A4R1R244_9FIRM|nr:hypothetical protein [Kineothrix alysoides]TCL59362.1 hypothetical protein EDD76_10499 [Kineothrix alysoides]
MIVFTSICTNYAHKARTLAESVKKNIPDAKFFVCLTEREKGEEMDFPYFDEVILSKDMWEGNFNQFIYKHSIVEASTAVKGQFFRYLLKTYPGEDKFVYLDPDCYVYSDFTELKQLLEKKPIILCPHLLQPGNIDMELSSTAHGVYNLGFLAVNHSEEAERFINWWADRLYLFCYDDIQRGIFTDQKWIDLAPCFFDAEILKHRGYDFATWSLLDCGMTNDGNHYFIKGDPLRFIHFSGYGKTIENCMRNWLQNEDHPFRKLYNDYQKLHEKNDSDNISTTKWSYSKYSSGEEIDDKLRIMYRSNYDVMFNCENPFALCNKEMRIRLSKKRNPIHYLHKGVRTLKDEGVKSLFSKTVKFVKSR